MNFATYQWRADGGYLPPSTSTSSNDGMAVLVAPWMLPPPWAYAPVAVPPPPVVMAAPPAVVPHSVTTVKKEKKKNSRAPPPLRPGMNYMFLRHHTHLHVFVKAVPVWEGKYVGRSFDFKQFKAPTAFTVRDVIAYVLDAEDEDEKCKGWAATEVHELGGGRWAKGTTFKWDSDRAKKTLAAVGWDKTRGEARPPVWVTIHKA